jgi:outer membrane protein OmpA-like peptidoglycan-associated protein
MRLLLGVLMLLALPVLVLVHRQLYFRSIQGPLLVQVSAQLDKPEFAQVEMSMVYADVVLDGVVAELPLREQARVLVNGIRGVRCREEDNHIRVPARLTATLNDGSLALTGWVHDDAVLNDVVAWIDARRPGLEIDTAGVQESPYVVAEAPPQPGQEAPRYLRPVLSVIDVPAALKIVRTGDVLIASGSLPTKALKDAVVAAVLGTNPKTFLNSGGVLAGAYVRGAKFADSQVLPEFLRAFYQSPAPGEFEADEQRLRVTGCVTPAMQRDWMAKLEKLAPNGKLTTEWRVFPSIYHFPDHRPLSKLSADATTALRDVLAACMVQFEPGIAYANSSEHPKLAAAANAILAAGPQARIVVGSHVDVTGDPETNTTMARRRGEAVVTELAGRGVPAHIMEVVVCEAVPGGDDLSRKVELLIK